LEVHLPSPLTANYLAFPGQFYGIPLNYVAEKTKIGAMKQPKMTTFGDRLNANGVMIHKQWYPASTEPGFNYDLETMPQGGPLFMEFQKMDYALNIAGSRQVGLLRTDEEENLRREAHFECSMARMEGLVVGQYRYYAGHMTVQEYAEKGLCVCWSPCACARVCSRYGDVMCPCGADLVLEGDSDNESEA
jgi:hypothetical protein